MTKSEDYTSEQLSDAKKVIEVLTKSPKEKRSMAAVAGEIFLSGMEAQKRIMEAEKESA